MVSKSTNLINQLKNKNHINISEFEFQIFYRKFQTNIKKARQFLNNNKYLILIKANKSNDNVLILKCVYDKKIKEFLYDQIIYRRIMKDNASNI